MPRTDLLALTPEDLATLTNRGTVKRAQKELRTPEISCEVADDPAGDLVFVWSDGVICRFPAGKSIQDAVCSSGLVGISRHVVRSVLAYQKLNTAQTQREEADPESLQDGATAQHGTSVWILAGSVTSNCGSIFAAPHSFRLGNDSSRECWWS